MKRPEGFSDEVRAIVAARSGGRCEVLGERTSDLQLHHRRPRQAGGSRRPDTNVASNALLLCLMCHTRIESYRSKAYDEGHLVRSGRSPIATPVLYRGEWRLLDDEGNTYRIPAPAGGVAS